MTCENCIHYDVCLKFADIRIILCGDKADKKCGMFKQTADKTEWISVDERLPLYGELVLVSSMDKITKKHQWFYIASYNKERDWWDGASFGQVTHWMPLPEPPKGE